MKMRIRWPLVEITWFALVVIQNANLLGMATINAANNTKLSVAVNDNYISQPDVRLKRQIYEIDDEFKPKRSEEASIHPQAFFHPVSNNSETIMPKFPLPMQNVLERSWDSIKKSNKEMLQNPMYQEGVNTKNNDFVKDKEYLVQKYLKNKDSSKIAEDFVMSPPNDYTEMESKDNSTMKYNDVDKAETRYKGHDEHDSCDQSYSGNRYSNKLESSNKYNHRKINKNNYQTGDKFKGKEKKKWKSSVDVGSGVRSRIEGTNSEPNKSRGIMEISQIHSVVLTNAGTVFDEVVKGLVFNVLDDNAGDERNKTAKGLHK